MSRLNGYGWVDRKAGLPISRLIGPSRSWRQGTAAERRPAESKRSTPAPNPAEPEAKAGPEAMTVQDRSFLLQRHLAWNVSCCRRARLPVRKQTVGGVVSQVGFDQKLGIAAPARPAVS